MTIESHRDLRVWQFSVDLVVSCYKITRNFPDSERFGLTSQLQRAAVSVPANIAEGHGRGSTNSYLYHLSVANGSLTELDTHLLIAERLDYVSSEKLKPLRSRLTDVGKMLTGLRKSLRQKQQKEDDK